MKLLGLTYFSHIMSPLCFYPPIASLEQTGRSEKIASRSFYFSCGIVLTIDSLKGHISLLHSRPSQMNIDTFVVALGKESLMRGEERMVGSQCCMTSSFHCHSRSTGSREIRQHWRRRGAVSKQGFELSFHTTDASWGSKAVGVRELLLFLLWGKVNRRVPAGCRQILSHQSPGCCRKDEAIQIWGVEYFLSSWPKHRTNFSVL